MELCFADIVGAVIVILVIATLFIPGTMFWVVRALGELLYWMDRVNVRVGCLRLYRISFGYTSIHPIKLNTVGYLWAGVYVKVLFWRISVTWSYPA